MEIVAEDDAGDEPVVDVDVDVVAVVDVVPEDVLDPPQPASAATSATASTGRDKAGKALGVPNREWPIEP